ncbi:hypothetical protein [Methyloversatilis sp.]|uniref:hypothetical protein n=1 Tax=Methyloversatilis sp. TaxID=2569862 RepID=UPI0035B23CC8
MSVAFPLKPEEIAAGQVVRVMSIGRDEFFQMLPGAVDLPLVHRGDSVSGRGWAMRTEVLPALHIGLLSLPRLRVQIDFAPRDVDFMLAFMARFDRHFQRGGG